MLSKIPHLDIVERVLWTAAQAAAGVLTDELTSGHISWRSVAYAFAYAVLKNVAAKKATGTPAVPK